MTVAMSSSSHCNLGKEIISISKRKQTFGHAKDNTRLNMNYGAINIISTTSRALQLIGQNVHRSSPLKTVSASGLRTINNHKPRKVGITRGDLIMEELLEGGVVYQYPFLIKSYETGPDNNITMVSIINQLQESSINHFKSCGLVSSGLGSSREMEKRDLIWVVHKLKIVVDHYPSWDDIVQLSTWINIRGKNSHHRDWIICDYKTGQIMIRAVGSFALMNKKTRKLSKICDEIMTEMKPYFLDCDPIVKEDYIMSKKPDVDSDDVNRTHLVTRLSDLDLNQHVNNANYSDFIVESAPRRLLESHRVSSITIKYLRECGIDKQLESVCTPINGSNLNKEDDVYLHHSLLTDGLELVQARTIWTPKPT